jgi:hypothetical protein
MWWIFSVLMALFYAYTAYARAKRKGLWSWSKFFLTIGFILFEAALISAPLLVLNTNSPYFWPVYGASWVVAAALFVWFLIQARKWKFPNSKTSLEAERELTRSK